MVPATWLLIGCVFATVATNGSIAREWRAGQVQQHHELKSFDAPVLNAQVNATSKNTSANPDVSSKQEAAGYYSENGGSHNNRVFATKFNKNKRAADDEPPNFRFVFSSDTEDGRLPLEALLGQDYMNFDNFNLNSEINENISTLLYGINPENQIDIAFGIEENSVEPNLLDEAEPYLLRAYHDFPNSLSIANNNDKLYNALVFLQKRFSGESGSKFNDFILPAFNQNDDRDKSSPGYERPANLINLEFHKQKHNYEPTFRSDYLDNQLDDNFFDTYAPKLIKKYFLSSPEHGFPRDTDIGNIVKHGPNFKTSIKDFSNGIDRLDEKLPSNRLEHFDDLDAEYDAFDKPEDHEEYDDYDSVIDKNEKYFTSKDDDLFVHARDTENGCFEDQEVSKEKFLSYSDVVQDVGTSVNEEDVTAVATSRPPRGWSPRMGKSKKENEQDMKIVREKRSIRDPQISSDASPVEKVPIFATQLVKKNLPSSSGLLDFLDDIVDETEIGGTNPWQKLHNRLMLTLMKNRIREKLLQPKEILEAQLKYGQQGILTVDNPGNSFASNPYLSASVNPQPNKDLGFIQDDITNIPRQYVSKDDVFSNTRKFNNALKSGQHDTFPSHVSSNKEQQDFGRVENSLSITKSPGPARMIASDQEHHTRQPDSVSDSNAFRDWGKGRYYESLEMPGKEEIEFGGKLVPLPTEKRYLLNVLSPKRFRYRQPFKIPKNLENNFIEEGLPDLNQARKLPYAAQRETFNPRMGKRDTRQVWDHNFGDDWWRHEPKSIHNELSSNEKMDTIHHYVFTPRVGKRAPTFIPRTGKRRFDFIPRAGKRTFSFIPRAGKRAFSFISRAGKRTFSFIPRAGKRTFSFIPRAGKRAFSFIPRAGKRTFSFIPRAGKRAFSFIPRAGKRTFSFIPRAGKRGFSFIPRAGKRNFSFIPRAG
ncbi:uncharacterized protein LOC108670005 [Hyalella azteca]|uniref:Uncharacterized protein LOC108670005 n=1 Tax=Hyalella azteca TaxID=294128 RepID=A0A8B7NH33_HYAAZ|nr:uncharacterized protein LOC108670005 [Hyalella azteca]